MKNFTLFLFTCLISSQLVKAQSNQIFKPFKVNIGIGKGMQFSEPGGAIFFMEPSYCFANKYKAGVKLEIARLSMKNISSTVFTFDHYFARSYSFSPFIGGGLGSYNVDESGGCGPGPSTIKIVSNTKHLGGMIRTGFETEFFRLGIEYSFVPTTFVSALDANGKVTNTVGYRNGYFGFKLGFNIGGGIKKHLK